MKIDIDSAVKKVQQFNKYLKSVKKISTTYGEIPEDLMYRSIAYMIYDLSQLYVPVDTGYLKSTGKVVKNSIGTYSVVYSASYAKFVHEIVENNHEYPTRSKFLEDAGYEILNELEEMGIVFDITFSMDTNDDVALHLDSLSIEDFKFNKNYSDYLLENIFKDIELEDIRRPESEVLY